VVWRIAGFALLRIRIDRSPARASVRSSSLADCSDRHALWPHPEFIARTGAARPSLQLPYGLFVIVLLSAAHRLSRQPVWLYLAGTAEQPDHRDFRADRDTVLALFRRVTNPVIRMLSNFDDYFSCSSHGGDGHGNCCHAHIGARTDAAAHHI